MAQDERAGFIFDPDAKIILKKIRKARTDKDGFDFTLSKRKAKIILSDKLKKKIKKKSKKALIAALES